MTPFTATAVLSRRPSPPHTLEGTLKRVDYKKRQLSLVARVDTWTLTLAPDCELWFNGEPAILRCFHPLDRVQVSYEEGSSGPVLTAMYGWD